MLALVLALAGPPVLGGPAGIEAQDDGAAARSEAAESGGAQRPDTVPAYVLEPLVVQGRSDN